jgi:hypothetical protein
MDIHNHKKRLDILLSRLDSDIRINKQNKKLILEFRDDLISQGIGQVRIFKYLSTLYQMFKESKSVLKLTIEEAKSVVIGIRIRVMIYLQV